MDPKEEVLKRLDALAAKLNVTAGHLWEVLVRQAQIEAWGWLAATVLAGVGVAVGCWLLRKSYLSGVRESDDGWGLFLLGCFMTVLGMVLVLIMGMGAVTGFLNPEYVALQELLRAVR